MLTTGIARIKPAVAQHRDKLTEDHFIHVAVFGGIQLKKSFRLMDSVCQFLSVSVIESAAICQLIESPPVSSMSSIAKLSKVYVVRLWLFTDYVEENIITVIHPMP